MVIRDEKSTETWFSSLTLLFFIFVGEGGDWGNGICVPLLPLWSCEALLPFSTTNLFWGGTVSELNGFPISKSKQEMIHRVKSWYRVCDCTLHFREFAGNPELNYRNIKASASFKFWLISIFPFTKISFLLSLIKWYICWLFWNLREVCIGYGSWNMEQDMSKLKPNYV